MNDIQTGIVGLMIVAAVGGWAVIELICWLFSFVSFGLAG